MKVYIVGSSCTWFSRNNTSFILDNEMLFDCSEGNYKEIIKHVNIHKLKSVFISHFHADHFFDLHILATLTMREGKKYGRTEKLRIYGPKGTLDQLVLINKSIFAGDDECDKNELCKMMEFIEVGDGDEFEENGYKVNVFALNHGKVYSQGYSFEDKSGKVIAFSADTRECDNLHKLLKNADVAFVDVAAMSDHPSHLDVNAFEKLTKKYVNCKMYPVHTSNTSQEFVEKNNLNAVNDGDLIII